MPAPAKTARPRSRSAARVTEKTLKLPLGQGVRVVALRFLADAESASEKLARGADARALHQFRVALRRLRSWLRAFQSDFSGTVKKRDRRVLRDIAAATNAGRDADVQLAWLEKTSKGLSVKRKRGADWLARYIEARKRLTGEQVDADVLRRFAEVRDDLRARLSNYEEAVDAPTIAPTLGVAIAARLDAHADALGEALGEIRTVDDEAPAHEGRIAAKRLRYLLEPAAPFVRSGDDMVDVLKSLQNELGSLHDAHVLGHELHGALHAAAAAGAERLERRSLGRGRRGHDTPRRGSSGGLIADAPQDALVAIGKRVREDADRAFRRVKKDWLGGRFDRFRKDVAAIAKRLDASHS
jgi:CHAD domain-containing protein